MSYLNRSHHLQSEKPTFTLQPVWLQHRSLERDSLVEATFCVGKVPRFFWVSPGLWAISLRKGLLVCHCIVEVFFVERFQRGESVGGDIFPPIVHGS